MSNKLVTVAPSPLFIRQDFFFNIKAIPRQKRKLAALFAPVPVLSVLSALC